MKRLGETKKKPIWPIVLVVLFLFALIPGFSHSEAPKAPEITLLSPGEGSPMGPRKTFNYQGYRYAFLDNGAAYSVPGEFLGQELGTLEGDILADPEAYGKQELAATFGLGGKVTAMKAYDPLFRVAVVDGEKTWLADRVGSLDGTPLELKEYFKTADFSRNVAAISIRDHLGREELQRVNGQLAKALMSHISDSSPAELSDEDYQQLGRAQSEGRSYQIVFLLDDRTEYTLYLIPDLSLTQVGDSTYVLPDNFGERFGSLFEGLPQAPIPQM